MMPESKKQSGFTLLEVLLAMLILAVALLALAKMSTSVIRGNAFSSKYTQSTTLAEQQLEILENTPFANLASGNDTSGIFTRTWTVAGAGTTRTVTMTVSWPDSNAPGGTRQTSITTVRSNF